MQIITNYGKFVEEFESVKKADKAKITVLFHENDTMTVQQHVDFMEMKLHPVFILSQYPDSETGMAFAAGMLMQEYGDCILVTYIESLLTQGSFANGKKTILFKKTLEEAIKAGGAEHRAVRKKKEKAEPAKQESKGRTRKKAESETTEAEDKEPGMNPPEESEGNSKENVTEEIIEDDNILKEEAALEEEEADLDTEDIENGSEKEYKAGEEFVHKAESLGIREQDCEPLRNALLDAVDVNELSRMLNDKVADVNDIITKAGKEFKALRELARKAEAEIYL